MLGRELHGQHTAERHTHEGRLFQAQAVKQLRKVADEIFSIKGAAQGKAVVLPAELITDNPKVLGKILGKRT